MNGKILVGTASWSDPRFVADWYPKKIAARDRLRWYAEHFNLVELNSSFYAIPSSDVVERWCQETPAGFVFDVKLYRLLSRHSTPINTLPRELRSKAESKGDKVILTPFLEKAVARRFLKEIEPFAECDKMGALLLQLSPSFSPKKHELSDLDDLFAVFNGWRLAVELRNRGWVDDEHVEETTKYFRRHKLAYVIVDAPESSHFMVMPDLKLVTNPKLSYFRFHGRNAHAFVTGRSVAERFNYFYNEKELQSLAKQVEQVAEDVVETHAIYNNNTSSYAPRNAMRFQQILAEKYPETLAWDPPDMSRKVTAELGLATT